MPRAKTMILGVAALAASVAAIRYARTARLPMSSAVPPPPRSRPPERPPSPKPSASTVVSKNSLSAAAKPSNDWASMSKEQLYEEARRREIPGRSKMTKDDLVKALANS